MSARRSNTTASTSREFRKTERATHQSLKQFIDVSISDANRKNYRTAAQHLAKQLGREPKVSDLVSPAIKATMERLEREQRSRKTIKNVRTTLLLMGRKAFELDLLERAPVVPWKRLPRSQSSCQSLMEFIRSVIPDSNQNRKNYLIAADHMADELGRKPKVSDLASGAIQRTLERLGRDGRKQSTIYAVRGLLVTLSTKAHALKLIEKPPAVRRISRARGIQIRPWNISELDRILGSARTMPGHVAGIPSHLWWPALILTLLSTGEHVGKIINLDRGSFDQATGELLIVGSSLQKLHGKATQALSAIIGFPSERLLPWKYDGGAAKTIIFHHLKRLLQRAGLPCTTTNMFQRFTQTGRADPGILDLVNPSAEFIPVEKPRRPTPRYRRRNATVTTPKIPTPLPDAVVRITFEKSCRLLEFFNENYVPLRMGDCKPDSIAQYRTTLERFSSYLGCDATFAFLNDDCVERFLSWMKSGGIFGNATINNHRAQILALWKHAWRKRKVDELPRDVPKLKVAKLVPEAWTLEELGKILNAARQMKGSVDATPLSLFFPALILSAYDSGARIDALMRAKFSAFDPISRWLKIPAADQKQSADQMLRCSQETTTAILALGTTKRELLFPWPFDRKKGHLTLIRYYRRILKAAGLPSGKRDLWHKLRRTSGTMVAKVLGRAAAQQHLGHSDPSVTERYLDNRMLAASPSEQIPRPVAPSGSSH